MPIADLLRTPLITLPLRNVSFGIYSLGSAVSLTGMWMERIAVGWLTWQLTESGFWLGVVAFADFFPVILIAPIAGAAADRWDRLQVVKVSQFVLLLQNQPGEIRRVLQLRDDGALDRDVESLEDARHEIVGQGPFLWGVAQEQTDDLSHLRLDLDDEDLLVVAHEDGAPAVGGQNAANLDWHHFILHAATV